MLLVFFFFFNATATTEIYTLSLHDALPIFDTLTLADDRLEAFYDNPNALRDYFRDIGRMVLAAEGRKAMIHTPTAISIFVCLSMVQLMAVFISMRCTLCGHFLQVALTLILVVGYAIAAS